MVADGATPPAVQASAYVVADLDTGAVLAAKAPHAKLRPASTLKTLTALVLLPRLKKADVVVGTDADAGIEGSKVGVYPGLRYSVDLLFEGMFLASGNDAVHALCVHDPGGVKGTIQRMNQKAKEIGALDTTVTDPTGLDADGQYSSAYDLALFAKAGLARPDFAEVRVDEVHGVPERRQTPARTRSRTRTSCCSTTTAPWASRPATRRSPATRSSERPAATATRWW